MKILIADDDPVSCRILERTLIRLGHEVVTVTDGPDAITALLQPDSPRMAILDWMMPGADGLVVCRVVRQRPAPYVYMILLTARGGREDVVAGLDAGADEFLTKPFDAGELRSRLRAGERVLELQERLLNAQAAMEVFATRDDLTGLWNRRVVLDMLGGEIRRANHEKRPLAVLMCDVDRFKHVNDTHGHSAGDAVLKSVAGMMQQELRDYDAIGRYGGEEFLIVLPGCDAASATIAAERARVRIAGQTVSTAGGPLAVTMSFGLAWTKPFDLGADMLVQLADEALYRAKSAGRNCIAQ